MTCYAGPGEPLKRHLVEVAQCVAREGELVARKIAKEFRVSPEEALDLMVFAALVHDAGKADARYSYDAGYYPHHEVISTTLAFSTLYKLGLVEGCNLSAPGGEIYKIILATIALHHYVHKSPRKDVALGYTPRCGDVVEALREWMPRSKLGANIREAALIIAEARVEPYPCYATLIVSATGAPLRLKVAASAVLGILNKCDREVAEKNRVRNSQTSP